MDVKTMKEWLKTAYPGDKWSNKVNKMPDKQAQALYLKFQREGRFK